MTKPRRPKTRSEGGKRRAPAKARASSEADVDELVRAIAGAEDHATVPEDPPGTIDLEPLELDGLELEAQELAVVAAEEVAEEEVEEILEERPASAAEERPISVGEDQLVEELVEAPPLAIAVHEDPAALAALEGAIAAAGHAAAIVEAGRDGLERLGPALGELDVVIAGLPGGEPLIGAALALGPRRPVVIAAVSGAAIDGVRHASELGADLVTMRPHDAARVAPVLLAAMRLLDERRRAVPGEPEPGALQPFELFQQVFERELERARRHGYPLGIALFAVEIPPPAPPPGVRGILRARAGNALIHAIRDVDVATVLPPDLSRAYDSVPSSDERFLVLLPYTDLGVAALLARRVLAAVAELPPVVTAGRTFAPRLVGAVAAAPAGQPLSFSRLMKDATRALEQARDDGAELAVPMTPEPGAQ